MNQASLFDQGTIEERFERFHADNPQVYHTLVRLARHVKERGRRRVGIRMLWERMRWELFLQTETNDFKLNDNYTSRYVRLIAEREPDLAELFETRKLRAR